jgi:tRNA A-37 threonylcarbamoyl transferase component Bud32
VIRLAKNSVRWELQPDFASFLDEILAHEKLRIKESQAKLVAIHTAGTKEFVVKRYRHSAFPLRPLKFFFKDSQAREEWKLALQLEKLGVPIVKHVALGEHWSSRGLLESILITEMFSGKPLNEIARLDTTAVFEFVQTLHERGVLQRDLHPGNILSSSTGELRLVDLHGIEVTPSLTSVERTDNLAYLSIFLSLPVSSEVKNRSQQLRKTIFEKRSHRALKENREFIRKRFGPLKWQVRLPLLNPATENILADPDSFFARCKKILKQSPSSTVGLGNGFVLKRSNLRKPTSLVKDLFRRSRAFRAFRKAYHLELVGVPTARAIAAADRRIGGVLLSSYLLMEEIPGAITLWKWTGDKSHAARSAAELIAALHDAGFTHRDLKASNLVFDSAGKMFLIDLDGLEFVEDVSVERAAADLARLARAADHLQNISNRERLLFLRRYCTQRKISPRELVSAFQS